MQKILRENGTPSLTVGSNDVISSKQNPFPGELHSSPTSGDVSLGCTLDYDATRENILNVFNKIPADIDTLFLYLNVNSGPGVIGLPGNEVVFRDELLEAMSMLTQKQIVLYFDGPNAASFLKELPPNTYAISSAGEFEMSWGTWCTPDEIVKDTHIKTCMSDLFTHFFIEHLKTADSATTSLQQQFDAIAPLVQK